MARCITIAAAQSGPVTRRESRRSVVERRVVQLRQAAAQAADLVVFPEVALTAFFPHWWIADERELDAWFEREMPGPDVEPLFAEARRLGVAFTLGYAELVEQGGRKRRFNTSVLVDKTGAIVGKYRKLHLPGHDDHRPHNPFQNLEQRYFEVGDLPLAAWPLGDARIGMCICNDRRWPETFRVMALKGAEMVVLGYNTPSDNVYAPHEPPYLRVFHHMLSLQAAAYQNGIWVVATAKAGKEDGFWLHGGSVIVAPTGEIVAKGTTEDDEVISYDCDLGLGEYIRNTTFNFAKHRRPEHYKLISERTGVKLEPSN